MMSHSEIQNWIIETIKSEEWCGIIPIFHSSPNRVWQKYKPLHTHHNTLVMRAEVVYFTVMQMDGKHSDPGLGAFHKHTKLCYFAVAKICCKGWNAFHEHLGHGVLCNCCAAIATGMQLIVKPEFVLSDQRFNSNKVLSSSADRFGNDHAVKRCKMSGYLERADHNR